MSFSRISAIVSHYRWGLGLFVALVLLCGSVLFLGNTATAVTTAPTKMNFQGRLTDSAGNAKPNGVYNMTFRLFTASSGGSAVWTEVRAVSASTGVTVTNGLFSVRLGDATAIPASLFASGGLYLEVELPSTATATCSGASCAAYTEGPMTPRNQMATSAYAFNSETLDGKDSSEFAILAGSNTFTQAQTIQVTSANALSIQNGSSVSVLNVDTSAQTVTIGSLASNGILIGSSQFTLYGNARSAEAASLIPEYPGATFTGDGTNNTGSLSSDFCSGTSRLSINTSVCAATESNNYYQWTNTQASAQDYDVYVRYKMPSNYSAGSMTNLTMDGWGTTTASEQVVLTFYNSGSATPCATLSNAVTTNATWTQATSASPLGACTIAADDTVTFKIHLVAGQNNFARAGKISFSYRGTF